MKETSLFEDFNTITHQEWKDKIIADLKGKAFDDTLVWRDESAIAHQPYYTSENLKANELAQQIQVAQKQTNDWKIVQEHNFNDPNWENLTQQSLNNGVDEVVLQHSSSDDEQEKLRHHLNHLNSEKLPNTFHIDIIASHLKGENELETNFEQLIEVTKQRITANNTSPFIMVDGSVYKNAGATIVQELAYTLHHAVEYLDRLTDAGLDAQAIFNRFYFKTAFGTSYFSEIAKGRAFRFLLQQLASAYQINSAPYIVGEASTYYHAHKDAHTNLLRLSSQCMSAVLGNCDAIQLASFDSHENASSLGIRMSRNIALILKEESFFSQVSDISSGSFYLESLTCEIAEKAWNLFLEIERNGGLIKEFDNGNLASTLTQAHQERINSYSSRAMVGVNKYKNDNATDLTVKSENSKGIKALVLSKEID